MTIRIDRVQAALVAALDGVASTVIMAHQEQPRGAATLIEVRMTAGPQAHTQEHAFGEVILPPTSVIVRVTAAVAGQRIVLPINGHDYVYDVAAEDDVTAIRDALLELVTDDEDAEQLLIEGVPAIDEDDPEDGIKLTAIEIGALQSIGTLLGSISVADEEIESGDDTALRRIGDEVMLITVDCFSKSTSPRLGAPALAARAIERLRRTSVVESLGAAGVALWSRGRVNDLAIIAGGHWESRAAFDLVAAVKSVEIEPVETIEQVDATITGELPQGSAQITLTVAAPAPP